MKKILLLVLGDNSLNKINKFLLNNALIHSGKQAEITTIASLDYEAEVNKLSSKAADLIIFQVGPNQLKDNAISPEFKGTIETAQAKNITVVAFSHMQPLLYGKETITEILGIPCQEKTDLDSWVQMIKTI